MATVGMILTWDNHRNSLDKEIKQYDKPKA